ncbi:MAG: extensin family protein [Paracoccaceae bacterium]
MNLRTTILTLLIFTSVAACGRSDRPIPDGMVQLCGDPALIGKVLPAIKPAGSACGIDQPVEVHFVSGVALNARPILNCKTARTLVTWVDEAAQPAVQSLRARITNLRVVSHYACRSRNSQRGARLSEHAKGNAIDIGAMTLSNGTVISVEEHWRAPKLGPILRKMYANACGMFGTTLGPDADRHHQDHMHFDTADYRNGAYCR